MSPTTVEHATASAELDSLVGRLFAPRFPAAWAVPVAAGTLADASSAAHEVGALSEGPRWFAVIGPGMVGICSQDLARRQRRDEKTLSAHHKLVDLSAAYELGREARTAEHLLWNSGLVEQQPVEDSGELDEDGRDPLHRGVPRQKITEWSRKSRVNMLRRTSTLDFEPMMLRGVPAMVTLTLPDNWLDYAPTGRAFKALVRTFGKRYARSWGEGLQGLWKLEFQRRGAPHLHILTVPPTGRSACVERKCIKARGAAGVECVDPGHRMAWSAWFASTWADVVVGQDDERGQRENMIKVHQHVKASADYAEGLRASDPKRVAVYFLKHNYAGDKEYQHDVPVEWTGEGDGPGRFWGYWRLDRADQPVPISPSEASYLARTLRHWSRAERPTRRVPVWRLAAPERVDVATGEVLPARYRGRTVTRRTRPMRGTNGFLIVNDGPGVTLMLAAALEPPARPVSIRALMLADLRRKKSTPAT